MTTMKNGTEGKKKAQKLNWISQCQENRQLQQRKEKRKKKKNPEESTEQVKK